MALILINQLVGLLLGIGGSLIAWWILFHAITPELIFSKQISRIKVDDEPGGIAYRVKFENAGRRSIIDLSIVAKLRIPGLNPQRPSSFETTYLPVSFLGQFPYVPSTRLRGNRHLIRIRVKKEGEFERAVYPTEIKDMAKKGELTLDDLLLINSQATVQLIAMGYDAFSGARKYFLSHEYTAADIISKPFKKNSIDIAE